MGTQSQARRLRRVVRALPTQEAAALLPAVAAQYRVRVRTLRRAVYLRLTGTSSMMAIASAWAKENNAKSVSVQEAIQWASAVHNLRPTWCPGDAIPPGTKMLLGTP